MFFDYGEENARMQRLPAKPLGTSPEAINAPNFLGVPAHAGERSLNFSGHTT